MPARALRPVSAIVAAREQRLAVEAHVRSWAPRYAAALRAYAVSLGDALRKAVDDEEDPIARVGERAARSAIADGRAVEARHVPAALAARAEELSGGSLSDRAGDWARERSADLVVGIGESTKQSVRRVVAAGAEGRLSEASVKKALREVLPLDPRRAGALVNYRAALEAKGMESSRMDALADLYARRLVAQRAEAVARTEGARALSEGRLDLWRELADEGAVDRRRVVRQWRTVRDEGVDAQCEDLDGELASIDGGYSTADAPPAHVNCRCVEVISLSEGG